ncbi:MAG: hypothetical protein J6U40_08975 [Kiritimatiellae bacterium]|nr:hypothetical protein [Kiritimatiellia bacterium]MBP5319835.1 hypothetical protein [Kiritimatiellia bacterium]
MIIYLQLDPFLMAKIRQFAESKKMTVDDAVIFLIQKGINTLCQAE